MHTDLCASTVFRVDALIRFPLPVRMTYLSLALAHVILVRYNTGITCRIVVGE